MRKIHEKRVPVDICLDLCRECDLVWLDGGELAILQLLFEGSKKGMNAEAMRRRAAAFEASPERMQRFKENLDRLCEKNGVLDIGAGSISADEALAEGLLLILRYAPLIL